MEIEIHITTRAVKNIAEAKNITQVTVEERTTKKRRAFNSLIIIRRSSTIDSSSRFIRVNTSPYSIDCKDTAVSIWQLLVYAMQAAQISAASATRNHKVIGHAASTPARQKANVIMA